MGRPAGSWWDLKDLAPHLSVASQMDPKDVSGGQTSVNPPPNTQCRFNHRQCANGVCASRGDDDTHARAHKHQDTNQNVQADTV